ncbi:hypothetical protein C1X83_04355 [Pseudomonas sp. GP01-A4]|nr:hypothetical protein C1X83_04355 [Pseudomonas sp. GP01-A4]
MEGQNNSGELQARSVWERACSRMRWISQYIWRLTLRIREQARSHTDRVSSVSRWSSGWRYHPQQQC